MSVSSVDVRAALETAPAWQRLAAVIGPLSTHVVAELADQVTGLLNDRIAQAEVVPLDVMSETVLSSIRRSKASLGMLHLRFGGNREHVAEALDVLVQRALVGDTGQTLDGETVWDVTPAGARHANDLMETP